MLHPQTSGGGEEGLRCYKSAVQVDGIWRLVFEAKLVAASSPTTLTLNPVLGVRVSGFRIWEFEALGLGYLKD